MNYLRRHKGKTKAHRLLRIYRARAGQCDFYADDGPLAQVLFRTRVPCSCEGCVRSRKHEGPTRQERLSDLSMQEQMIEWMN
jgi:hypothetical protein